MFGGLSSAGRAPALQAGGRRFDPVSLHQFPSQSARAKHRGYVLRIEYFGLGIVPTLIVLTIGCRSLKIWKKFNYVLEAR